MELEVKRKKGIDHLVSGYSPGKVEEEKENTIEGSLGLSELQTKYCLLMGSLRGEDFVQGKTMPHINEELSSSMINAFLLFTTKYEYHRNYESFTGEFVARLLQNSFKAGYNNFSLNIARTPHLRHMNYFRGDEGNPLCLTINGSQDLCCGNFVEYIDITFNGRTNICAVRARLSTFTFHGMVSGVGLSSYCCNFNTTNRLALDRLIHGIPRKDGKGLPSGNKITLIHENGEKEVVRDYR